MEKFEFKANYRDQDYLFNEYVTKNRSSKEIAKELHVSFKLIEIWLKEFNIPIRDVYA